MRKVLIVGAVIAALMLCGFSGYLGSCYLSAERQINNQSKQLSSSKKQIAELNKQLKKAQSSIRDLQSENRSLSSKLADSTSNSESGLKVSLAVMARDLLWEEAIKDTYLNRNAPAYLVREQTDVWNNTEIAKITGFKMKVTDTGSN